MTRHIHIHLVDASSTEQKLERATQSLLNHARRGATTANYRSLSKIDRFEEAKEQAIKEGIWRKFCETKGWDPNCTGYDFFA